MTSFIKLFHLSTPATDSTALNDWLANSDLAFSKLNPIAKCQLVLSQSLITHYFSLLYDDTPYSIGRHDNQSIAIVVQYRESLKELLRQIKLLPKFPYVENTIEACEFLLGISSNAHRLVKDELCNILNQDIEKKSLPDVLDASFYRTYLHYILAGYKSNVKDPNTIFSQADNASFSECKLPVFCLQGNMVSYTYHPFAGYEFNADVLNDKSNQELYRTIFGFWVGLCSSGLTVDSLLGFIASQAFVFDTAKIPLYSMSWLWYRLYQIMFNWSNPLNQRIPEPNLSDSRSCEFLAKQLTSFLVYHRKTHNVIFDDKALLAEILSLGNPMGDEDKSVIEYLSGNQATAVSMEALNKFSESLYSKFPELFQKSPSESEVLDSSTAREAISKPIEGDVSTTDATHLSPTDKPEIDLSIDLSIPETVEMFSFRMKVGRKIDLILADPPSSLSSNQLLLLKKLRIKYLYLLNVNTIYQIVNSMFHIKLPVTQ